MDRILKLGLILFLCVSTYALTFGHAKPDGDASGRDWAAYNGGVEQQHYSSLKQINRDNVARLKVAWTYDTGDAFPESEMECNPLVINGVLYALSPKGRVIALDAATGKLKWSFDPNDGRPVTGKVRNRGVTWWSDGASKRLFAAAGPYLYGLDPDTGKPVPAFGVNGRVDLRENLGRVPEEQSISMSTPGIVYKDLLITGSIVAETLPASPGDIRAYDVRAGKLRWSFHTIPHPGELGYDTWPKDAWKYIGGVNNWCGMSLDPERGIVFVPTGSASFDFYGSNRLGDDLFANCLIALKAETGERIWHFQSVRHDIWDRDLPAPPTLVRVKRDGREIDAVAQITKSGYVFLFERETGKPLFPIVERPAPGGAMDGEKAAASQPFPTKPAPFARQFLGPGDVTDRTPEARKDALERLARMRSAGQFVPPSKEGSIIFPGLDGGGEWGGSTWDPETGLLYVNANEMPWILQLIDRPRAQATTASALYQSSCSTCHGHDMRGDPPEFPSLLGAGSRFTEAQLSAFIKTGAGRMPGFHFSAERLHALISFIREDKDGPAPGEDDQPPIWQKYMFAGYNRFLDKDGYPAVRPPWGTLNAIDLNSGEIKWSIPLGDYPELAARGLKDTGTSNYGGSLSTAGGLLFISATCFDKQFRAFDKRTGQILWQTTLPAAGNATPATYEVNGRQYVVIGAGGGKGSESGGSYVAFALKR